MAMTSSSSDLNPWHLLRYGDAEQALALLRRVYARQSTPSHIMELGVAYLWTGDYDSARAHFNDAIRKFPRSMSSFYGMAGVAEWCMGECAAAVGDWRAGLNARFADAAGLGIRLPLLLFTASVLAP
jgi:hypothetical protein